MTVSCPTCGDKFTHIGTHWNRGTCDRPEFTDKQMEWLIGLLLGDGYVYHADGKNPYFRLIMTNRDFLEWFDTIFGIHTTGLSAHLTAKERARKDRESGFNPGAVAENYMATYSVTTRSHPGLGPLSHWYDSGEKIPPKELSLTSESAKMWYVTDGTIEIAHRGQPRVSIACKSFLQSGVDVSYWFRNTPFSPTVMDKEVRLNYEQSEQFLEWAGAPPRGFEYKW